VAVEGRSESEVMAAQDQALQTIYHATKMLQTEKDSKCRLCKQFDETAEHNIPACPMLTKEQYIKRHDGLCAELHYNTCKEMWMQWDNQHWYDHVPKPVDTSRAGKVTTWWILQVQTDRTIPNKKTGHPNPW